ncbi:MAG: hypothetical protein WCG84_00225 [Candidatus Moraniibacteriota bacterium]
MENLLENRIVITSGFRFIDIDAFACIYAYQELLRLQGKLAQAVITAPLNVSITKKYRALNFYAKEFVASDVDQFVVVDVSDPEQIEGFVSAEKTVYIFDHHPGFESFWFDRIGSDAIIEPIGAAATLVVREYHKANFFSKISPLAAELLAVAILSNTLFFQAKISTNEDREAYDELKKIFHAPNDFEHRYFSEVQRGIESEFQSALRDDSKRFDVNGHSLFIAQLEVWNELPIINDRLKDVRTFLENTTDKCAFLNLIGLEIGSNVLVFRDAESLVWVRQCFPEFEYDLENNTAKTPHVMLRKEIIPRLLSGPIE